MAWKQPIPTGLEKTFGNDWACNLLYRELIYRACNKDSLFTDTRGKTTPIKRGQVVFGRNSFSVYLGGMSSHKIERNLKKLEKVYKLVSRQANRNFTLVSINKYDELVEIEQANAQATRKQRASNAQAVSTSKPVYPVINSSLEELENSLPPDENLDETEKPIDKDEKKSANEEEAGASPPPGEDKNEKEYGNKKINMLDPVLKKECSVVQWRESAAWQRRYLYLLVQLVDSLGQPEFFARVNFMRRDAFHRKKLGSLEYLYRTIRSLSGTYIENY